MIRINNAVLRADINKLKEKSMRVRKAFGDRDTLTHVAEQGIRIIADRTEKGFDADGKSFKPYTDEYKEKREKSGRSTRPNLRWSGNMLGDMHSVFERWGRAAIVFLKGEQAAKAAGNMEKREFFDIRRSNEINGLVKAAEGKVDDIIKREGLA